MSSRSGEDLTPREKEVIELLSTGLTNEEIARRLGISADGVKYHVSGIFRRLRVKNRQEAASRHLGTEGDVLTRREREVIELLSTGLTNEEIARQLGISVAGVKQHVSGILRRLDVRSRREAASAHLRTSGGGRFAALAPLMFLRKLPFGWFGKAVAGGALTTTAAGVALLAWGVMSTSPSATTPCAAGPGSDVAQQCAQSVLLAGDAGAGAPPCALKDGAVWCRGASSGYDRLTGSITWDAVPGLASGVSAIVNGGCALKNGGVWCADNWGASLDPAQAAVVLPDLSSGVSVISGSCALKDAGVWCWDSSALDVGPIAVAGLETGVSAISAADPGGCALKGAGVWCWGLDYRSLDLPPVAVSGLPNGITAISGLCAIKDGGLWCWEGGARAVAVPGLERGVSAVTATSFLPLAFGPEEPELCAIKDGGVWCWAATTDPVAIPGLGSGVSQISTGAFHSCALKDSAVLCWGFNGSGQLGDGTRISSPLPVAVARLTSGVSAISAGGNRSCAAKGADVFCWGYMGSAAAGGQSTSSAPVLVRFGLSSASADIAPEPSTDSAVGP